jgi:predicted nucleic acid-binding protein
VVVAETIYADPSALLKLYLREPESQVMARWRGSIRGSLRVTHHGRLELINAIGLAAHRGIINLSIHDGALKDLDDDFTRGSYVQADLLWRATLTRASDISREFTPVIGCRSFDVLHVASALELGLRSFVTFDARQIRLAQAVKLNVLVPA